MKYRLMKTVACDGHHVHAEDSVPVGGFVDTAHNWWGPLYDINKAYSRAEAYNRIDEGQCPCPCQVEVVELE